MSIERIRTELRTVESSIIEDRATGGLYKLPSNISADAKAMYKAVGIKRTNHPTKVIHSKKCSGKQKIYAIDF